MIYSIQNIVPSLEQKKHVKSRADGSFCSTVDVSLFNQETRKIDSAIALRMKNVEPHTDFWVGMDEPKDYRAFFWLMGIPKYEYLNIQVGNYAKKMYAGDCIEFDDRIMHSVQSNHTWYGIAYQVAV